MRCAEGKAGTHGTSNGSTVPPPPSPLRAPPAAAPSAYRATLQCSPRNANPVSNGWVLPLLVYGRAGTCSLRITEIVLTKMLGHLGPITVQFPKSFGLFITNGF